MIRHCFWFVSFSYSLFAIGQSPQKQLAAQRTSSIIKIDGNLDEAAWKNAVPAKDFIEWRPNAGKPEDPATRTVVYLLYDNNSVYVAGYCYERTKDSIAKELVGRDVVGLMNQEGLWTGIEKIHPPLRLSFSPYFSAYLDHYPNKTTGVKDWTSSVNGGMDLKYGITEGFTLDMTLIPDFGQVQSDNHILNLSPFEVKYNENRSFFTEGTELFNKGDLFYSRRIGSQPIRYFDVQDTSAAQYHIHAVEHFLKNPQESKLINATKISGRTKKGLGIGFFNAITEPMNAVIEDETGNKRKILTNPLTNYNIIVFDQTLKNHSALSLINTNVTRADKYYNANVTAGLFDLNNKKNTYNLNGKLAVSQIYGTLQKNSVCQAHILGFSKKWGNWRFQLIEDATDNKYDINDMGILFNNNYFDHYFWTSYRWQKPTTWYNRIQVNYNAYYSLLYNKVLNQKIDSKFQTFATNVNANMQLKNL